MTTATLLRAMDPADKSKSYKLRQQKKRMDQEKWARIWFAKLCHFHNVSENNRWNFSAQQVIEFLKFRIKFGDPAWKRLKIVDALCLYRKLEPVKNPASLAFIRMKLKEIAARQSESQNQSDSSSQANHGPNNRSEPARNIAHNDDIVGKINPNEPVAIRLLREKLRLAGRAWNTEKAYVKWVRRFLASMSLLDGDKYLQAKRSNVEAFLTDLVVDGNVAAATQDQAFFGRAFFFEHVIQKDLGNIESLRSTKPKLRPTVMSKNEIRRVLEKFSGTYELIAKLLYGTGMRISEVLRLRVKDLDFDQRQIVVQCSKGKKSRLVPLPETLVDSLRRVLAWRTALHDQDLSDDTASVYLPDALDRKYPEAHREFKWQFVFASMRLSRNPLTNRLHRHHIHRDSFSPRTAACCSAKQS